jgi:F-type H+-transporting ATPase subunit b
MVLAVNLLAPNVGLIIWITLTFLLLLFVLRRFAWGPISKALNEREDRIDASIKSAEKSLAEARQLQADNEKARRQAEQDAQQILREARETAEQLRGEEVDKTRREIQGLREQARSEIEREKESALNELRSEVADLAIQAAERILEETIDDEKHRRLVDGFIRQLPRN